MQASSLACRARAFAFVFAEEAASTAVPGQDNHSIQQSDTAAKVKTLDKTLLHAIAGKALEEQLACVLGGGLNL